MINLIIQREGFRNINLREAKQQEWHSYVRDAAPTYPGYRPLMPECSPFYIYGDKALTADLIGGTHAILPYPRLEKLGYRVVTL